ncbi:MAG: Ca-activated chloride channel family protein, partial [Myxococcota bacterium]
EYDYPQPTGRHPFNVQFEAFPDPFRDGRHIMRVGVQGMDLSQSTRPPLHLTFLVDVSGSMSSADKLGLAQQSLHMLVDTLQEGDTVALATYAGRVAEILPPTDSVNKRAIHDAIEALSSGGSTAMSSGIDLAYQLAQRSFEDGAENRVIVMSDGDANVGATSWEQLLGQLKVHADAGITLSTIGFGQGNYRDTLMEQLANNGDGNNFYIDSQKQAQRVFVEQMGSTIFTIARDVKLQVDFNTDSVMAYRLLGYENRDIADEDFRDDRVDAGEVGAGHTVTAMYEVILREDFDATLATLNLRYEAPGADKTAEELSFPFPGSALSETESLTSKDARIAYAAATFAEILRGSPHTAEFSMSTLIAYTKRAKRGADDAELIALMETAKRLGAGGSNVSMR